MRVIAGRFRSRVLKPVPGMNTRPTPDRLRETLFNILAPRIEGLTFLDAYAGTGAVGIEALSRGARHSIFIEKRAEALGVLRDNIRSLHLEAEATVVRGSAAVLIANQKCDIVFLDPPYQNTSDYGTCFEAVPATGCALAVAQHATKLVLPEGFAEFTKTRVVKQGDNSLSFYERS